MAEPKTLRGRVLAAADELFYEHGIAAVSMDAIREQAGVALKGIYGEFGSKAGLVAAYLAHRDDAWMSWLSSTLDGTGDGPRGQLLGIFDALDAWFAEPGFAGCAFINAFGESAGAGQIAVQATEHKERLATLVAELATQVSPVRAPQLAEELMVLIEGAIVRASLGRRPEAARTARAVAALILGERAACDDASPDDASPDDASPDDASPAASR